MAAPLPPVVLSFTSKNITKSSTGIHLWPVEQRNGPISTYQVIVLKIADGVKELPGGYESKLTDSNNASKDNLNFYVAAEITNDPVHEDSWEFTVGDEETYGAYINKGLEVREGYIIYQRAVTNDNGVILGGDASEVAKISVQEDHKPVIKDLPERTIVAAGTLAILSCQVIGDPDLSVTWSKDGNTSIPHAQFENDGRILAIKDVLPRDGGVYECKASNKFGESRTATILIVADVHNIFIASVIALSCIVFVLVVVIGVLIWRLRRTVANNRTTTSGKAFTDDVGQPDSPRDQHVSEPGSYMELHPRPLQEQLPTAPHYQALQGKNEAPEYYNVGFNKENKEKEDTEIYDEIGNARC
ncbi:Cell adhesion molecule [Desmophyllum pertusum]|uniref:Cell adhesion molecule n=1 Tax=Desmophyllum pertusum TaxID=174260 RepID=A0A9W9YP00_9CNID|nr:Cell adhesion molecule [Desmophyllum pertusum]